MNPEAELKLAGRFKFEAVKLDTDGREISRRVVADWFDNLITDQGLEFIGTVDGWLGACQVGAASTAPLVTDTSLGSRIGGTTVFAPGSHTYFSPATPPYYGSHTRIYRFNAGVATGNLSEVGVGTSPTGPTLFSRALILDGAGNPTTITILPDESLDVTYELRIYPPLEDVPFSLIMSGVEYTGVIRASRVTNSTYWGRGAGNYWVAAHTYMTAHEGTIGPITGGPSGVSTTGSSGMTVTNAPYAAGSRQRTTTIFWPLTNLNLTSGQIHSIDTGFNHISERMPGAFQLSFSPPIPKTPSKTLQLTFRISWARKTL